MSRANQDGLYYRRFCPSVKCVSLPIRDRLSPRAAHSSMFAKAGIIYRTYAVLHLEMYFASGRAEQTTFFTKCLHVVQTFREKDHSVPCCRRRFCRSSGQTPGLHVNRVSPVIYRTYALDDQTGRLILVTACFAHSSKAKILLGLVHISRIIHTRYAVTDPKGHCASGRVEDS